MRSFARKQPGPGRQRFKLCAMDRVVLKLTWRTASESGFYKKEENGYERGK